MKYILKYQSISFKNLIFLTSLLIATPLIYLTNKIGFDFGLASIGIIVGLMLWFTSLIDYRTGIFFIITGGLSMFTIGRLVEQDIPLGTLLEVMIFSTTVSMFISHHLNNVTILPYLKKTPFLLMTLFLIYSFFSILNPELESINGWIPDFKRQLALYCFFLLIYLGKIGIKEQIKFSQILLLLWGIAAIYGCYQEFFGFADFELKYILKSEAKKNLFFLISGIKRKFSLFSDPSSFGISMAATAGIFLSILGQIKLSTKSTYLLIGLIISLLSMAFSGTRTAYMAFAAGASLFILITFNRIETKIISSLLLILFAIIMLAPIHNNITLNRVRSAFKMNDDASMNVRNKNREKIQPYILKHPLGGGLGTTGGRGIDYNPGHHLAGFATDSGYLQTATELGWIALILLLVQYYFVLSTGLRIFFETEKKIIKVLIGPCLICYFIFVVAQFAQTAVGQFPDSFLFYTAAAVILRTSVNFPTNKII